MATYIETLKRQNDQILPRTVASAVSTDGGQTVEASLGARELLTNKLTSTTGITSSSTDTQYPSAKAVYDFVNGLITDAIGGNY